jgi:hypothetical protein
VLPGTNFCLCSSSRATSTERPAQIGMAAAVETGPDRDYGAGKEDIEHRRSVAQIEKGRWERLWPVIACGAGLFSDGYLNNVRCLMLQHPIATNPN